MGSMRGPAAEEATKVIEKYPNRDCYEGGIDADGAKSGWGKYTFANGSVYEGSWRAGKMDGWGEFVMSETHDRFVGEWEQAERVFGTYYYANGDLYQGGFQQSMKHGRSVIWENREMYEAVYSRDKLLSKVPWRSRPAAGSPTRAGDGELRERLAESQRRCAEMEETAAQQQTQLAILTKELQALQRENTRAHQIMAAGGGAAPSSARGRSGARSRPEQRSHSGGAPRVRSAAAAREREAALAADENARRRGQAASRVVHRAKRNGPQFNSMNENLLREQFRYFY